MRPVVRRMLFITLAGGLLSACAHETAEDRAGYPNLSDVSDRPVVVLTPERTEELTQILNEEREAAQAFAALGYRQSAADLPINEPAPVAAPVAPDPIVAPDRIAPMREAPTAVPLSTLREEAMPQPMTPPSEQVSAEALSAAEHPEELLATEKDFK